MPSLVWIQDPNDAHANPYEYEVQDQFYREAERYLGHLYNGLDRYVLKFHKDDRSVEKAIWMLQIDAVDALRDCLETLQSKRHRLTSRLFRDVIESLDLAAYFASRDDASTRDLATWYRDEVVPNRRYRAFLSRVGAKPESKDKARRYSSLSRFAHRTYRALLQSYSLGRDDLLVYDSHSPILVLPATISLYCVVLAQLVLDATTALTSGGLISREEAYAAWVDSIEEETIPFRFMHHVPPSTR